jgi:antirestriction protein ArdC
MKEITAKLEQGVKDIFTSAKFAEYLKTMSRFHKYSTRNTILIHMQMPGATLVAGFNAWKSKFDRHVVKGAKAISILAPVPFTKREEKEKLDPDTRKPILDEHGMPVIEISEKHLARFKPVKVFDVSQTDGKPLPSLAQDLTGNVEQYEAFMDALRAVSPLPIVIEPLGDRDGYCRFGEKIGICEGMSEIQTVCAVIHEITHAKLHDIESLRLTDEKATPKDRRTEEVEAESVSYVVCQHFGIETGENSLGYVATWSEGRELKELNASLNTIRKTAAELIDAIDEKFQEIVKERNITFAIGEEQMSIDEPAAATEPTPGAVYAQCCNIVSDMAKSDTAYANAIQNADEQNARTECEAAVKRVIVALFVNQENDYADLFRHYLDNPDFRGRLDDYVFAKTYLDPKNTQRNAVKEPTPETEEPKSPDLNTMPDPLTTVADRNSYGYDYDEMLPLSPNRAAELFDAGHTIYLLHTDNTEAIAFDREEIQHYDGLCGIERTEWENSPDYAAQKATVVSAEGSLESELLHGGGNRFGVYQIKGGQEMREYLMEASTRHSNTGLAVNRGNYELAFTMPISEDFSPVGDKTDFLGQIRETFKASPSTGNQSRAVSVSDVIVVNYGGEITSHYVDRMGFKGLPAFVGEETQPAQTAETLSQVGNRQTEYTGATVAQLEADVKAGKVISLTGLAHAVHAERKADSPAASKSGRPTLMERLEAGKQKAAEQGAQKPANERNADKDIRS